MFYYSVFGLGIHSAIQFPELDPIPAAADVIVRWSNDLETLPAESDFTLGDSDADNYPFLRTSSSEIQLLWPGVGCAAVRGGQEIVVQAEQGVTEETLRHYLLGSALGVLLHQRGLFPLHASVNAIGEGAVAFIGEWGAGKSSTAAGLQAIGYPLIADDIAAIDLKGTVPTVYPGIPRIKLWPDSVIALGSDPHSLPRIHPEYEKRSLPTANSEENKPLPLTRIYVLDIGSPLAIEEVTPKDALFEIISNWYGVRFGPDFLEPEERIVHFERCAWLAQTIPASRLVRPDSLRLLPEIAQHIINQAKDDGLII